MWVEVNIWSTICYGATVYIRGQTSAPSLPTVRLIKPHHWQKWLQIALTICKLFSIFDEFTDRLQNDSEENIQTIPTIGFNVEVLQYKNIKFQVNELFCKHVYFVSHLLTTNELDWLTQPSALNWLSLNWLVYRFGILEDRPLLGLTGDATTPTQMPLFLWWTAATMRGLESLNKNWWPCSRFEQNLPKNKKPVQYLCTCFMLQRQYGCM